MFGIQGAQEGPAGGSKAYFWQFWPFSIGFDVFPLVSDGPMVQVFCFLLKRLKRMGRSFWAQKGYLALALDHLALVLARPISGTRTNERLPYVSFSFVSGSGFQQGWVLIKPSLMSGAWKAFPGSSWLLLEGPNLCNSTKKKLPYDS